MIRQLADPPDKLAPNPHYRSGPKMKLYDLDRVKAVERTPEFAARRRSAEARSKISRSVADKKEDQLLESIEEMEIKVRVLPDGVVLERAIESYNSAPRRGRDDFRAYKDGDPKFLMRIQVNYIRHELTRYDLALWETAGKIGVVEAKRRIRAKVFGAIGEAYPQFGDECRRQASTRNLVVRH